MTESRIERTKGPMQPATASSQGLGCLRLGSAQSRAAARALASSRRGREAEDYWDRPLNCAGLAERMRAARDYHFEREARGESPEPWKPICVPAGKENTVRGQLAARINAARARMRQYEAR
jgi:hypothetical protein